MNNKAQFTPGPWEVTGPNTCEVITSNTGTYKPIRTIAKVNGYWDGEVLANMRLIAAAPAMYEALQHAGMSYHHPACKSKGEYAANPEKYCSCHVQKAKAALAQAEGSNHA